MHGSAYFLKVQSLVCSSQFFIHCVTVTRTDRRGAAARVNVSLRRWLARRREKRHWLDWLSQWLTDSTDSVWVTDWLSFHCAFVYCLVEGGWSKNVHSFVLSYLKISQSVNKRRFPNSLSVSVKSVIFPMYAAGDWVVTDGFVSVLLSVCFSVKFAHINFPHMIG